MLFVAGLGCSAAALWARHTDVAGLLGARIARAGGELAPQTIARLHSGQTSTLLLVTGLALLALGGAVLRFRTTLSRLVERVLALLFGPTVVAVNVVMVLWYLPTLTRGFFRFDDFELLTRAQAGGFWATVLLPHGDHVLPLTRALAWLGYKLFGVTAWPYNLWLWLCMGSVLTTGLFLLEELRTSRAAQGVFAGLVIFWSPWAEMMAGYYILSTYLLIAALGLACSWFLLRWQQAAKLRHGLGATGCVLVAPLVDVSGVYVAALAGVWLGLDLVAVGERAGWFSWNRPLLLGLGAAVIGSGGCLLYAYQVVNPGVFLGMAGQTDRGLGELARDLAYLIGSGTLLSMVTPFVYARLSVGLLAGLTAGVSLAFVVFLGRAWLASDRTRRLALLAMGLVIGGCALMVVLGRPPSDSWTVRWAAKHICPVYLWLCLLLATGWDSLRAACTAQRRGVMAELTVIGLLGFGALQTAFGALGLLVAFPPFGYPAELRDAERRRAAVAELRTEVTALSARLGPDAVVPTVDGAALQAACPSLFSYNLSHYRPFLGEAAEALTLVRTAAMQPWHTAAVRTVNNLRAAVSPDFLRLLAAEPRLQRLYCAEIPLVGHTSREDIGAGNVLTVEREGGTEFVLKAGSWDPESMPRLLISRADGPGGTLPKTTVIFRSGLLKRDWRGIVQTEEATGPTVAVDLRQTCAFALSEEVADLRVVLATPGRYRFRLAPADR